MCLGLILIVRLARRSITVLEMEPMSITIFSIKPRGERFVARARACAEDARIWLEIEFSWRDQGSLWERARDEVLRYLDIA